MKERVDKLLQLVSKASQMPNNSFHQYSINRDFGYLTGIMEVLDLVEPYNINEAGLNQCLDELEKDYKYLKT